ncbi:unnamed protein product [Brassica rapa subsp. trilocularis]
MQIATVTVQGISEITGNGTNAKATSLQAYIFIT